VAAAEPTKGEYIANNMLAETFADHTHSVSFDGANFRIEMTVGRLESTSDGKAVSRQHTALRLVVPLAGTTDLLSRLTNSLVELEKRGVIRRDAPKPAVAPGTSATN
jgi:hypothetical protein